PLTAASATFALKAGVWFRRARLLIVAPDSQASACPLSGRNSTYRPVQICGAGSSWRTKAPLFIFSEGFSPPFLEASIEHLCRSKADWILTLGFLNRSSDVPESKLLTDLMMYVVPPARWGEVFAIFVK
ncbi:hypothetical protein, partial [Bradyrhizobium sp. F1.4.3]|uniref:hypothetical protein n=1 Tax=Bradyrhizobium sp. F1.4.3 TaxID=3156356 RepID=UPI0033924150